MDKSESVFPQTKGCTPATAPLTQKQKDYEQKCNLYATQGIALSPQQQEVCLLAAVEYRAEMTDWLTQNLPITEIKDPAVLSDKLLVRFGQDPAQAAELADRLMELEPDFYPATKAALISRFIRLGQNPGSIEDADKEAKLLERAETSNPNDPEIPFVDIGRSMRTGRSEAILQAADRLAGSAAAYYGKAYVAFGAHQYDQAIHFLDEAIRLSSDHSIRHSLLTVRTAIVRGAGPETPGVFFSPISY